MGSSGLVVYGERLSFRRHVRFGGFSLWVSIYLIYLSTSLPLLSAQPNPHEGRSAVSGSRGPTCLLMPGWEADTERAVVVFERSHRFIFTGRGLFIRAVLR